MQMEAKEAMELTEQGTEQQTSPRREHAGDSQRILSSLQVSTDTQTHMEIILGQGKLTRRLKKMIPGNHIGPGIICFHQPKWKSSQFKGPQKKYFRAFYL